MSKLDHLICRRSFQVFESVIKVSRWLIFYSKSFEFQRIFHLNFQTFPNKFPITFSIFPESEDSIANDQTRERESMINDGTNTTKGRERDAVVHEKTEEKKTIKRYLQLNTWKGTRRVTRAKENYMKTIEVV